MKNKVTGLLKKVISVLTSMAKAKSLALKGKANALKTRLMVMYLLRNKKILTTSISRKLNALTSHHKQRQELKADDDDKEEKEEEEEEEEESKNIMLYPNVHDFVYLPVPNHYGHGCNEQVKNGDDEEDKYPDLTHSLFQTEDGDFEDPGGSVIDLVKNSKEEVGEEFRLEDDIDRVADLFIKRFHRQIRLQKQLSLQKRHHQLSSRSDASEEHLIS